jgi:LysM repeat protein
MTIKNDMNRLQYRKGGLLKLLLKKGDTLFSIARENELSIAELLEVNSQIKNPDEIYAGDTVFIPSKGKAPVAKKPSKQESFLSRFRKKPVERPKFISYQIKKGDNLATIAKNNSLNIDQLVRSNRAIKNPNNIRIGQKINIPQFGIYAQQDFQKRINLPASKPKDRFLPSNVRQLLNDINPLSRMKRKYNIGMEDFTEADTTPDEIEALRKIVKSNLDKGKQVLEYDDFKTSENPYDDVGGDAIGIQKAINKFKDPAFSMKTLLGQASITTNANGETVVTDRYNFNEENPDSFKDYAMKAARVASDPIYGSFREAGSIFGSDEGEGSFVRINLGKLL